MERNGEHSDKGGEIACRLEGAGLDGEVVGPADSVWGEVGGLGSAEDLVWDEGMGLGGGWPMVLGRTFPMPGLGPDTVRSMATHMEDLATPAMGLPTVRTMQTHTGVRRTGWPSLE